jgi:hypothetical protein
MAPSLPFHPGVSARPFCSEYTPLAVSAEGLLGPSEAMGLPAVFGVVGQPLEINFRR